MKTRPELVEMYRRAQGSVAFVDESFDLRAGRRFYLLSAVVVEAAKVRSRSGRLHREQPGLIHAAEMRAEGRLDDLAAATGAAAAVHDSAHIFVAEIPHDDPTGKRTRSRLIEEVAGKLSGDHGVGTFVLDSRVLADADSADWRVFRRMRSVGLVDRHLTAVHTRPSREKLLQASDLLAYAYRQQRVFGNADLMAMYAPEKFHEHRVEIAPVAQEIAARAQRAAAQQQVAAAGLAKMMAARKPVATGVQGRVAAGAPGGAGGQFAAKVNSAPTTSLG